MKRSSNSQACLNVLRWTTETHLTVDLLDDSMKFLNVTLFISNVLDLLKSLQCQLEKKM